MVGSFGRLSTIFAITVGGLLLAQDQASGTKSKPAVPPPGANEADYFHENELAVSRLMNERRFEEALALWQERIAAIERLPISTDRGYLDYVANLMTLGNLLQKNYRIRESAEAYAKIIGIAQRNRSSSHPGNWILAEADANIFLGIASSTLGNLKSAVTYFEAAAALLRGHRGADVLSRLATLRLQQAQLRNLLNDYDTMIPLLEEAETGAVKLEELLASHPALRSKVAPVDPWTARMQRLGGMIAANQLAQIDPLLQALVDHRHDAFAQSKLPQDQKSLAAAVRIQGMVAYQRDQYEAAERFLQQSLKLYDGSGQAEWLERFPVLSDRGCVFARQGKLDEAIKDFREAKQLAELHPQSTSPTWRWGINTNLATALLARPHAAARDEAMALLTTCLDEQEAVIDDLFPLLVDRQRRSFLAYHRWTLGVYLGGFAERAPEELYQRVLRYKAATFARSLHFGKTGHEGLTLLAASLGAVSPFLSSHDSIGYGFLTGSLQGWSTAPRELLSNAASELAALKIMQSAGASDVLLNKRLRTLQGQVDQLDRVIELLSAQPSSGKIPVPTPVIVAKAIPASEVFIDFVEFTYFPATRESNDALQRQHRLMAFVVGKNRVRAVLFPDSMDAISHAISDWLKALDPMMTASFGNPLDVAQLNVAGQTIVHSVWERLTQHFPAEAIRHVTISPDGDLWRLPFAAMPKDAKSTGYLIDQYCFSSVISAHQLIAAAHADNVDTAKPRQALLIGNIDYAGRHPSLEMHRLFQVVESNYLRVFSGSTVRKRENQDATRWNVLDEFSRGADDVIVAGHIFSTEKRPIAERLLRSEPTALPEIQTYMPLSPTNDGKPAQMFQEDFRARLTPPPRTMGAVGCEGGGGTLTLGDGVNGFAKAALQAGVRTTWAPLWPFRAGLAEPLLIKFMDGYLKEGVPMAQALREAQLQYRHLRGDARNHPRYWAAWVIIGQHDLLALPSTKNSGQQP